MRIRKNDKLQNEEIELIANVSDSLAHPLRVEIFRYIYSQNIQRKLVCNKDLVAEFNYSQSTISQHISKLLESDIVVAEKKGSKSYYFANIGILGKYLAAVKKLNTPKDN